MDIKIFTDIKPDVSKAINLYIQQGWGKSSDYNEEVWSKAFANSSFITAYNKDELVGFARLLSDGAHDTQILEFVVDVAYQKKGIGKSLVQTLATNYGHTDIYCNTAEIAEQFFIQNGFKKNKLKNISYKKQ